VDIKEAATTPAAAQPGEPGPVRRRLLAAGVAGAAASLLPWFNGRAAATTPGGDTPDESFTGSGDDFDPATTNASDITTPGTGGPAGTGDTGGSQPPTGDTTGSSGAATTTTAPPKRPTAADMDLLVFAQSLELTIRDLFDVAIDGGVFEAGVATDIVAVREAAEGYGTAIAGLIGKAASNKPLPDLFDQLSASFSGDAKAVALAAADLLDVAVATHIDSIGQLEGVDASALIASIAVTESRTSTMLKAVAGADLETQLASDATALTPTTSGE
jgi:hypothetical protein